MMPAMLNLSHAFCKAITELEDSLLSAQAEKLHTPFLSKPVSFRGVLHLQNRTRACMQMGERVVVVGRSTRAALPFSSSTL